MISSTATTAMATSEVVVSQPPPLVLLLENVDVLRWVISFIGPKQYRFMAVICKGFHAAYVQQIPNDTETKLNASTIEYAKICWEEMKHSLYYQKDQLAWHYQRRRLACSAASYGNLPALQYLRSVGCEWCEWTCAFAAGNGHLHVLQWCRDNDCPWNEWTCEYAAKNGHLDVLDWARENGCLWNQ